MRTSAQVRAAFLLLMLVAVGCSQDKATNRPSAEKPRTVEVGKPAPEIEGPDISGKAFKLSDYRGKVVVLDFWGFW